MSGTTKSLKMDASVQVDPHLPKLLDFSDFAVENVYLSKVDGHKFVLFFVLYGYGCSVLACPSYYLKVLYFRLCCETMEIVYFPVHT